MMAAKGVSIAIATAIATDNSQWVHVLPAGVSSGRDGRGPYKMESAQAVMNATRSYHGKKQMVVDFEHQSIHAPSNGKPAPAAGWISDLQAKPDGIWALVNWTAQAAQMIRDKAYRYVSPVFHHDNAGNITRLLNVGLTNNPNLDLTAMARSEETFMNENDLASIRDALGLGPDADLSDILAAIGALRTSANTANPDPARFVPIGDFERVVADANKLRQGVSAQAAETHVVACISAGKLMPSLKDWGFALCSTNLPAFDSFIERTGSHFVRMTQGSQLPGGKPDKHSASLTDDELAICSNMGLTEEQFILGREGR